MKSILTDDMNKDTNHIKDIFLLDIVSFNIDKY